MVASRVVSRLALATERLKDFPLSGPVIEELRGKGVREIVMFPYRIAYAANEGRIDILKVWHGKQLISLEEF